mgnify:CR=1 FL=1|jgi:large subunit ribosomal protein L16
MLQPARRKYRKDMRGRRRGVASRGTDVSFGEFGLKAMGTAWLSAAQIEAGRRAITNNLKRKGRLWIRVFPDKPVTARPAGQRMGSGKGDIDRYVAVVQPGRVIYEIAGVPVEVAKVAMERAADKMPFKTKFIVKEEQI